MVNFTAPSFRLGIMAVTLALPFRIVAEADDWPQWRGPRRDSVWEERGLSDSFPPDGPPVLWRAPCGTGFSSPCIVDGKVYVTYSRVTATAVDEYVRCFDAVTGREIWMYTYPVQYPEYGSDPAHPFGPSATPVVVGGKIYTLGRASNLVCLDAATGRLIWHNDLPKQFGTKEDLRGFNCSPLVEGNLVIMEVAKSAQACVIAFDKDTGRQIWESLNEVPSDSSPIVVAAAGRRQLIVWAYHSVAALDPEKGDVLWRRAINTGGSYAIASPLWDGKRLLLGGLMLQLASDKPDATVLWPEDPRPARIRGSDTSSPLIFHDLVLSPLPKGQLECLDAATGKQLWLVDTLTEANTGASLHLTAVPSIDRVFIFTDRGDLILAHITAAAYKEVGRIHLIEPTNEFGARRMAWTPPSYANGCIFLRNDNEVVCVSLRGKR